MDQREVRFDVMEAIGWLVREDEKNIVLVSARSLLTDSGRDVSVTTGLVLLRADIEEMVRLGRFDMEEDR